MTDSREPGQVTDPSRLRPAASRPYALDLILRFAAFGLERMRSPLRLGLVLGALGLVIGGTGLGLSGRPAGWLAVALGLALGLAVALVLLISYLRIRAGGLVGRLQADTEALRIQGSARAVMDEQARASLAAEMRQAQAALIARLEEAERRQAVLAEERDAAQRALLDNRLAELQARLEGSSRDAALRMKAEAERGFELRLQQQADGLDRRIAEAARQATAMAIDRLELRLENVQAEIAGRIDAVANQSRQDTEALEPRLRSEIQDRLATATDRLELRLENVQADLTGRIEAASGQSRQELAAIQPRLEAEVQDRLTAATDRLEARIEASASALSLRLGEATAALRADYGAPSDLVRTAVLETALKAQQSQFEASLAEAVEAQRSLIRSRLSEQGQAALRARQEVQALIDGLQDRLARMDMRLEEADLAQAEALAQALARAGDMLDAQRDELNAALNQMAEGLDGRLEQVSEAGRRDVTAVSDRLDEVSQAALGEVDKLAGHLAQVSEASRRDIDALTGRLGQVETGVDELRERTLILSEQIAAAPDLQAAQAVLRSEMLQRIEEIHQGATAALAAGAEARDQERAEISEALAGLEASLREALSKAASRAEVEQASQRLGQVLAELRDRQQALEDHVVETRGAADRVGAIEGRVGALAERVDAVASRPLADPEEVKALKARVEALAKPQGPVADPAEVTRLGQELSQAAATLSRMGGANAALAQPFNRQLSKASLDRLMTHWVKVLGINISSSAMAYLADQIGRLEGRGEGRIAAPIETVLLRLLALRSLPPGDKKVLEIGTLFGLGASVLYNLRGSRSERLELTLIDPLEGYYDAGAVDPTTGVEVSEAMLRSNLAATGVPESDWRLLKGLSTRPDILSQAADRLYDYVLIDGDHSTAGVAADFEAYGPLVRPGGLIVFDDYGSEHWPGIKPYVDEVVRKDPNWTWIGGEFRTGLLSRRSTAEAPAPGDRPRRRASRTPA